MKLYNERQWTRWRRIESGIEGEIRTTQKRNLRKHACLRISVCVCVCAGVLFLVFRKGEVENQVSIDGMIHIT